MTIIEPGEDPYLILRIKLQNKITEKKTFYTIISYIFERKAKFDGIDKIKFKKKT